MKRYLLILALCGSVQAQESYNPWTELSERLHERVRQNEAISRHEEAMEQLKEIERQQEEILSKQQEILNQQQPGFIFGN